MILHMSVVTVHMVYFSACAFSSPFVNHYVHPKLEILNSNLSKRNKSTSFYRSRSLLVVSLSGGVHVHAHLGCFDLCKH